MDMYREYILDLYHRPHNKTELAEYHGRHRALNATCGDEVDIMLVVTDGVITDIGYIGDGCAISQAAVSLLTDHAKGTHIRDLKSMTDQDVFELLSIPLSHTRFGCALVGLTALQGAIENYSSSKQ